MTYNDAYKRVQDRSQAAFAGGLAVTDKLTVDLVDPADVTRRMLSGYVEGEDLEQVLVGVRNAAANALNLMVLCPDGPSMLASIQLLMVQHVMLGVALRDDA